MLIEVHLLSRINYLGSSKLEVNKFPIYRDIIKKHKNLRKII